MKPIILFSSLFLLSSFVIFRFDQSTQSQVAQLKIVYVDALIETDSDVPCDNFNYAFSKDEYMEKKITSKKELEKFSSILNSFQKDEHTSSIDTRAKIYITYADEEKSVLCVDRFGYSVMNSNYVGINEKIISFIKDNCKGFE